MQKSLLFIALLCIAMCLLPDAQAQSKQNRSCGTELYMQQQMSADPSIKFKMDAIEKHVANYIANPSNQNLKNAVITIPVVFHILYSNSTQNISNAQIQSQLDVLNEDFNALNSDISGVPSAFQGVIGNAQIQFCLATNDPNGNPTTGILRVSTSNSSFGVNNAIKFSSQGGSDAWPASDYLNFWVGNLSGGLLGYAQFPGGPASTDGVVCLYTSIGRPPHNPFTNSFNLGRTGTHEVGHWLNLRHIWGDSNCGNDLVNDTPTQQTSNSGCPNFPHVTCNNGPNGDMFMNYMDYVVDACMIMFSAGQATRMNATFAQGGPRESLLSSNGCSIQASCQNPPVAGNAVASPTSLCSGTTTDLTLNGNSGGAGQTFQWQSSPNNSTWTNISGATDSTYTATVTSNAYYRCNVTCESTTVSSASVLVIVTSAVAGTISGPANILSGPEGGIYYLTGYTGNIQWQFSIFPTGPFSDFTGATADSIDVVASSPGTYYLRAEVSLPGCSPAYSNVVTIMADPRTGDNINIPIAISNTPFIYTDSTIAFSGFTNQNTSQTNSQSSADVYFEITTGTCTDGLNISTCLSPTDTYIHLLDSTGNLIVSDDDNGPFCPGIGNPGSISAAVQANTKYFIVVEGYNTVTGVFTLEVSETDSDPISITAGINDETCESSTDGSVVVTVNGGLPPYNYLWNTTPANTTSNILSLDGGNYSLVVTDADGCTAQKSYSISSPSLIFPSSIITDPSTSTSQDGEINLTTSGGTAPYNFLWSNGSTNEDVTGLVEGVYYCYITDANGCAHLYMITLVGGPNINHSGSRIVNGNNITDLNIYPNPTDKLLFIEWDAKAHQMLQVIIYDANMREVSKENMTSNAGFNIKKFDASNFRAGMYFMKLQGIDGNRVLKFIVE